MYQLALIAHSLNRWVVLALGLLSVALVLRERVLVRGPIARAHLLPFAAVLLLQVVLGLLLHFLLSPLRNTGAEAERLIADKATALHYWKSEHPTMGGATLAIALAALAAARRDTLPGRLATAVALLASVLGALLTVPWARPMIR